MPRRAEPYSQVVHVCSFIRCGTDAYANGPRLARAPHVQRQSPYDPMDATHQTEAVGRYSQGYVSREARLCSVSLRPETCAPVENLSAAGLMQDSNHQSVARSLLIKLMQGKVAHTDAHSPGGRIALQIKVN